MNDDLNLDGRSVDGYGDECPEFAECGQYLRSTFLPNIDECNEHGRWKWRKASDLYDYGWYEALDL